MTSCRFWLVCLLTPLQLPPGLGSLWRHRSGTGAREPDYPSPSAARPAEAPAVGPPADLIVILAGYRSCLCQRHQGGCSCSAGEPLEVWQWLQC